MKSRGTETSAINLFLEGNKGKRRTWRAERHETKKNASQREDSGESRDLTKNGTGTFHSGTGSIGHYGSSNDRKQRRAA